jgi:hypothetical protein
LPLRQSKGNALPLAFAVEAYNMISFSKLGFSGFEKKKKRRYIDSSEHF